MLLRSLCAAFLVGALGGAVLACGGTSAPEPDDELTGTGTGASTLPTLEAKEPGARTDLGAPTEEENVSPDSPTYVTGPLGFIVRDARAFVGSRYAHDMCGHANDRNIHGILLTSFAGACSRANARSGDGILRLDFTAESGATPSPGTYPIPPAPEPFDLHEPAACGRAWQAVGDACSEGVIMRDTQTLGGTLELSKSDEEGMEGTFEVAIRRGTSSGVVRGRFVAPRCSADADACTLR